MSDRVGSARVESDESAISGTALQPIDQDHLLLRDGAIVAVHGWLHPPGFVVGEVTYVPDGAGPHRLLGRDYRKAYIRQGRALPEERRYQIRDATGSVFDQAHLFRSKSIVSVARIDRYLPCSPVAGRDGVHGPVSGAVARTWEAARRLLGEAAGRVDVAVTGSLNLRPEPGYARAPNDVDLVFTGSAVDISDLLSAMSATTRSSPTTRIYEYGKGWQIRIRTDGGLLCSFFRYADPGQAALRGLRGVRTVRHDVQVRGTVVDDTHNAYMPTVLLIDVLESNAPAVLTSGRILPVVIGHLRSRGEFFNGDVGAFTGSLVEITDDSGTYPALSVLDGDNSRLLTPPWRPY